jgi:hypothetical protein
MRGLIGREKAKMRAFSTLTHFVCFFRSLFVRLCVIV